MIGPRSMKLERALPSLIEALSPEDFTGDARFIAETYGVEIATRMAFDFGGVKLYISRATIRELLRRYVQKVHNGKNTKSLARELGVSDNTVYRWLKEAGDSEG